MGLRFANVAAHKQMFSSGLIIYHARCLSITLLANSAEADVTAKKITPENINLRRNHCR